MYQPLILTLQVDRRSQDHYLGGPWEKAGTYPF
jgi:hypothetical protein